MNQILLLQLWNLFKYTEFIKVFRQSDKTFFNVLTNVQLGNADENTEKIVQKRCKEKSYKNYPNDGLYIYADNASTVMRKQIVLNNPSVGAYSIEANK